MGNAQRLRRQNFRSGFIGCPPSEFKLLEGLAHLPLQRGILPPSDRFEPLGNQDLGANPERDHRPGVMKNRVLNRR